MTGIQYIIRSMKFVVEYSKTPGYDVDMSKWDMFMKWTEFSSSPI